MRRFAAAEAGGAQRSAHVPLVTFANAGGDWVGCIEQQLGQDGNITADPLFCAMDEGDYRIASNSPCAPPNSPDCGLIGAWPVGCGGPVSVVPTSWGGIKRGYSR